MYPAIVVNYIPVVFVYQNISAVEIFSEKFYHADIYSVKTYSALLFQRYVVGNFIFLKKINK